MLIQFTFSELWCPVLLSRDGEDAANVELGLVLVREVELLLLVDGSGGGAGPGVRGGAAQPLARRGLVILRAAAQLARGQQPVVGGEEEDVLGVGEPEVLDEPYVITGD